MLLPPNAIQTPLRPQINRIPDNRRARHAPIGERIDRLRFILLADGQNVRLAIHIKQIDMPVRDGRRRAKTAAQPLLPMLLAGLGVDARGETVVADGEQHVVDEQERWPARTRFHRFPGDLSGRKRAAAALLDRKHSRHVPARQEDQIVAKHRLAGFVHAAVMDPP